MAFGGLRQYFRGSAIALLIEGKMNSRRHVIAPSVRGKIVLMILRTFVLSEIDRIGFGFINPLYQSGLREEKGGKQMHSDWHLSRTNGGW